MTSIRVAYSVDERLNNIKTLILLLSAVQMPRAKLLARLQADGYILDEILLAIGDLTAEGKVVEE